MTLQEALEQGAWALSGAQSSGPACNPLVLCTIRVEALRRLMEAAETETPTG